MGMFDEIRCKYPLPIALPDWVDWFQTKDLDCTLRQFEITEDGRLIELPAEPDTWNDADPGDWSDYHADLRFYTTNLAASGPDGRWVQSGTGDDYESFEFVARFTDGKLTRIRLLEHSKEPARPVSEWKLASQLQG